MSRLFSLYLEHRAPRKRSTYEREQDSRKAEAWARFLGAGKDPHKITLAEWEGFLDARRSGAIDSHGNLIPPEERRPVRARTVESDASWLRWVLNWGTRWQDEQGRYLLRESPVRGYETPVEKNPRRPVATQDRYEALRAVSDRVTMRLGGTDRRTRSSLSELLDIVNGTGRRLSAVCALRYEDLRLADGPYGAIRWPADTDKSGRETVVPVGPAVRAALDRILRDRPGIGERTCSPRLAPRCSP